MGMGGVIYGQPHIVFKLKKHIRVCSRFEFHVEHSKESNFFSSKLKNPNILSDCHNSDEINYLLNAFRLKKIG